MITIEMSGVGIECAEVRAPNGERVAIVVYTDPQSGLRVVIPHDAASGRLVASHLDGRPAIHVANGAALPTPTLPPR